MQPLHLLRRCVEPCLSFRRPQSLALCHGLTGWRGPAELQLLRCVLCYSFRRWRIRSVTEEPSTCKKSRGKQQARVALCLCYCFSYSFVFTLASMSCQRGGRVCSLTQSSVPARYKTPLVQTVFLEEGRSRRRKQTAREAKGAVFSAQPGSECSAGILLLRLTVV